MTYDIRSSMFLVTTFQEFIMMITDMSAVATKILLCATMSIVNSVVLFETKGIVA